jgi:hypothetical protein
MNRRLTLAGLLILAGAPFACGSSGDLSPTGTPDAGFVGSGDSGVQSPDATAPSTDGGVAPSPLADGGVDADASPDAGPLTVHVTSGGAPEPGTPIVFHDATGAVLSSATTDATGSVTQMMVPGGQVTAILGTLEDPSPVTVQEVQPGDTITFVAAPPFSSDIVGFFTVELPAGIWDAGIGDAGNGDGDAGGVTETVSAGLCSITLPNFLSVGSNCQTGGTFPLFVSARDENQRELAYTYQKGNLVPDSGGSEAPEDVAVARPFSPVTVLQTIAVTNIPADADGGIIDYVQTSDTEIADGLTTQLTLLSQGAKVNGTESDVYPAHPGYADAVQSEALYTHATPCPNPDPYYDLAWALVADTRAAAPAASQTTTFDLSALPLVTSSALDTSDAGTAERPSVTWTSQAPLTAADGIFTIVHWYVSEPEVSGTWTILAPSSSTRTHAPALPASLAAYGPSSSSSFFNPPAVAALQSTLAPGYAKLRANTGLLPTIDNFVQMPTLPASGTLFVSVYFPTNF